MDINECLLYLSDTGVNIEEAEREMEIIKSALVSAENALVDYVENLEKRGATMGYGRAVIATVQAAMVIIGAESLTIGHEHPLNYLLR